MYSLEEAGDVADALIAKEVTIQDKMWGLSNERADALQGQMVRAAVAQASFAMSRYPGFLDMPQTEEEVLAEIKEYIYPPDWDGLRSYGSTVANLVVAAAYLRSEIKRLVAAGEDTTRTKRGEPYKHAAPYMSSEEAAK